MCFQHLLSLFSVRDRPLLPQSCMMLGITLLGDLPRPMKALEASDLSSQQLLTNALMPPEENGSPSGNGDFSMSVVSVPRGVSRINYTRYIPLRPQSSEKRF